MSFELPLGIEIPDVSGLASGYEKSAENRGCFTALLSTERLLPFISGFTEALEEPIFFFLELPCTAEEEKEIKANADQSDQSDRPHFRLYYLDNCTKEVIGAIIKTYGGLLTNDGVCRFGFGGNKSEDEIYVQSYKVISLYCSGERLERRTEKLLKECGAQKRGELKTPWDILSAENTGVCMKIEEDGISVSDIPDLLREAGMYFAEIV
jgi:hypothetical protein